MGFTAQDWALLEDQGKKASDFKNHIKNVVEGYFKENFKPLRISMLCKIVRSRQKRVPTSDFIRYLVSLDELISVYSPTTGTLYIYPKGTDWTLDEMRGQCIEIDEERETRANVKRRESMNLYWEGKKRGG